MCLCGIHAGVLIENKSTLQVGIHDSLEFAEI